MYKQLSKRDETPKYHQSKQTAPSPGEAGPGSSSDPDVFSFWSWMETGQEPEGCLESRFLRGPAGMPCFLRFQASSRCLGSLFAKQKTLDSKTQAAELALGVGTPGKTGRSGSLYPPALTSHSLRVAWHRPECPPPQKPYCHRMTRVGQRQTCHY